MPSSPERHAPKAVERFIFFSDAVFAFAITLLAAGLKLPDGVRPKTEQELLVALAAMGPMLLCYVVTFVVVAQLWVRHHKLFENLCNYDPLLIALNFLLLLCVSAIPFAIDLTLSSHMIPLATEIYAGTLTANGLAGAAVWWHTRRTPGLLSEPPAGDALWREGLEQLTLPFFGSALLAMMLASPPEAFGRNTGIAAVGVLIAKRILRRLFPEKPAPAAAP